MSNLSTQIFSALAVEKFKRFIYFRDIKILRLVNIKFLIQVGRGEQVTPLFGDIRACKFVGKVSIDVTNAKTSFGS